MLRSGLSSASYRNSTPDEVIAAAKKAGLRGIEWTSDTHAPHGDLAQAEKLLISTLRAGMTISAYGSFYRLQGHEDGSRFPEILQTTLRLHAPTLRVWAGPDGKSGMEDLVRGAREIADQAGKFGIMICVEPHERSIVRDYSALADLVEQVNHPFFKVCWAPLSGCDRAIAALERLAPQLALLHVRNWSPGYERLPLDSDGSNWAQILAAFARKSEGSALDSWALIEYLEDNKAETLAREASALNNLIKGI